MMRSTGMVVLLLMVGGTAWADRFQIKDRDSRGAFAVPFATVQLSDGTVLGWTDRYGRFTVTTLANGEHTVEVVRESRTRTARLTVDGGKTLKVVFLEED